MNLKMKAIKVDAVVDVLEKHLIEYFIQAKADCKASFIESQGTNSTGHQTVGNDAKYATARAQKLLEEMMARAIATSRGDRLPKKSSLGGSV